MRALQSNFKNVCGGALPSQTVGKAYCEYALVSTNLTVILAPPLPFSLRHTFIPLV
jgi:hypothetical protein